MTGTNIRAQHTACPGMKPKTRSPGTEILVRNQILGALLRTEYGRLIAKMEHVELKRRESGDEARRNHDDRPDGADHQRNIDSSRFERGDRARDPEFLAGCCDSYN